MTDYQALQVGVNWLVNGTLAFIVGVVVILVISTIRDLVRGD